VKFASWSLFGRLIFMLGAATLLSYCASGFWLYHTAVAEADQMFDAALDHTAHAVLAVVRDEASELTETKAFAYELALIDQSDQNDVVYQVRGPNGILVFRSHGAPIAPLAGSHDHGFSVVHINGVQYRVFTLATELDAATIHVGQPVARRVEVTRAGAVRLLAPGAAQMLALVMTVAWTVRRTTKPLVSYAAALDHLVPDSDTSIDGSRLPRELQSVARAVNGLLARVHDSLLRERTLTADAAHELRNPLAALRLQAQVALRSANRAERTTALHELLGASDRAARLVDSVFTLARFDANTATSIGTDRIHVGRLAQLVTREFMPLTDLRGIRIVMTSDDSLMRGDEDAIGIALRNLLHNALRFAHTQIVMVIARNEDKVTITIRDDGPGFTEESARRAFHRFFRGPEQGRSSDGAGLGLALVLRVVQLHFGTIRIVPGIDGGAGVEVQFDLIS
jgi:two-component system, OmpR family, sensor histidine kinase QseC